MKVRNGVPQGATLQGSRGRYLVATPARQGANAWLFAARPVQEGGQEPPTPGAEAGAAPPVALKVAKLEGIADARNELATHDQLVARHGERYLRLTLPILDQGEVELDDDKLGKQRVPWFARRLVEGGLDEWVLRTPPPSLPQRVAVLAHVCRLVRELHSLGQAHRDLKPGNLLWGRRRDGTLDVWLADFGTVKEASDNARTATIRGTRAYMPVEALLGVTSFGHDVYSLGVTAYELLVGSEPKAAVAGHAGFAGQLGVVGTAALAALAGRQLELREERERLGDATKGLGPETQARLVAAVLQALELDPRRRSLAALQSGLDAALRGQGGGIAGPERARWDAARVEQARLRLAALRGAR